MKNDESEIYLWGSLNDPFSRKYRLFQRQEILKKIREDFYEEGFLEVETPLLVKTTCPDTHIESIQTKHGYLITSTEYQIKRMMAGGFEKVFTLCKNFREGDEGRYHSAEFTMLEWARTNEELETIEQDAERFIKKCFQTIHNQKTWLEFNGEEIEFLNLPWQHLTVREAFQEHLGLENLKDFSLKPLIEASRKANIDLPNEFINDRNFIISFLLDKLQSHLGKKVPTFLHAWPSFLSASAPLCQDDPLMTKRTELYIGGVEIANGFPFLRDAKIQRELFEQELENRKLQGKVHINIDERYLSALQNLPKGAGMALGIDRLVMVLTGSTQLKCVQTFAWDEL